MDERSPISIRGVKGVIEQRVEGALNNLLLYTNPLHGEVLYLYLVLTQELWSSVFRCEENKFTSSAVLRDGEKDYNHIKQVGFAIIVFARKFF